MSQLSAELDHSEQREKQIQRPRGEEGLGVLEEQREASMTGVQRATGKVGDKKCIM